MARRPPLDDRELLRLLEAGHGQSEAARLLGYPVGTVTGRVKKLRDRGILAPGNVVDWEALDRWEEKHQPGAYQEREDTESNTHVIPHVIPQVISRKTISNTLFEQDLREIVQWWRERKRMSEVIRNSHAKTRRTYFIYDDVHAAIEHQAKDEGVTVTEIVNRALTAYLQGHRGGIDQS